MIEEEEEREHLQQMQRLEEEYDIVDIPPSPLRDYSNGNRRYHPSVDTFNWVVGPRRNLSPLEEAQLFVRLRERTLKAAALGVRPNFHDIYNPTSTDSAVTMET